MKKALYTVILLPVLLTAVSCSSIQKSAMRSVADMLSSPGGSSTFTSDDDPVLVGDALPLALKLYELILEQDPENAELAAATGRNFVMYAGAFVQMPAEMLDDEQWREADDARKRAKKLFRRGRGYLLDSLEMRHEGFLAMLGNGSYDDAAAMLTPEDAETAYWAALAWLGMASTDPLDMELGTTLDRATLLLIRSMELNETNAGIHDVMIQVYLSLPAAIVSTMRERSPAAAAFMDGYYAAQGVGTDPVDRAFHHYNRAVELSGGKEPSPHITMATAYSIRQQDVAGFRSYLARVLEIDPEEDSDNRLLVIIYQNRARWLLENMELFFLVDF